MFYFYLRSTFKGVTTVEKLKFVIRSSYKLIIRVNQTLI